MDLGFFIRSRVRLVGLIVGPIVLIMSAHIFFTAHHRKHSAEAEQHKNVLSVLPELDLRVGLASQAVKPFAPENTQNAEAMDTLTERVRKSAEENDLTVRSLSIDRAKGSPHVKNMDISIKAIGSLASFIQFLNDLHSPDDLMSVASCSLVGSGVMDNPTYHANIVCRFGMLTL